MNREQAHLIAELVRTIRTGWDSRGIVAALLPLKDRDLADVTWAAIRAAQNAAITTPAGIALDGDHWRPTIRVAETPEERQARILEQARERAEAERNRATVTDRLAASQPYRQAARQAIAQARSRSRQETTTT